MASAPRETAGTYPVTRADPVRVVACVYTFNPKRNDRLTLLRECLESLAEADEVWLVDNGSTDGTDWTGMPVKYVNTSGLTTCGMGANLCARVCLGADADLCVLSDDDIYWRPGWRQKLEAWWVDAPADLAVTGCHLEADYPWNERSGTLTCGGQTGLIRNSTGSGTWTFPAAMWTHIGPIPQQIQGHGDVPACERLIDRGFRIAQIDVAEHRGGTSTWGNQTYEKYGSDLTEIRELLEA
jgi:Glycosyl transferase family 2